MLAFYLMAAFLTGSPETDADITINRPVIDVDAHLADQLALRLIRHHDALTAVSLVYTSVSERRKDQPEGAYWRRAIAVSETGMFKSDNSHGHKRRPWQYDPSRKTLVITPSESTLLENLNRSMVILDYDTSEAPNSIQGENFFDVLGWWPFINWPPPQWYGHAYSMRAMLNEGSYRLLPEKEVVGSKPCYTLIVNDVLTVWCDCDRPECVLKGEVYDPTTKELDSRFEMREYEEVGDNIWLPKQFRFTRFDSHAHTPQLREKVVVDKTFLVSDIKINEDVDMSIFRQEYAPGTVRVIGTQKETGYEPVVDGQLDHFNSILNWCRFCSLEEKAKQNSRWNDRLLVFVLCFLVGSCLVSRRFLRIACKRSDNSN
ncbi:hypothetical protein [Gimesia panareensis]|uniref:hypothetical protein n=1 Tax=Gimesia panareensis TaxID=2527978 RepID=UPI0011891999|nr:hypothetical protein [Gimesia panareensis]QDU49316.1 hypothetical protein Pan110_16350 [Gimesia panareensis]